MSPGDASLILGLIVAGLFWFFALYRVNRERPPEGALLDEVFSKPLMRDDLAAYLAQVQQAEAAYRARHLEAVNDYLHALNAYFTGQLPDEPASIRAHDARIDGGEE